MPELSQPRAEPFRQRLRTWRAGRLLVDTHRAHLYFPGARHSSWAVSAQALLVQIPDAFTYDEATYFRVRNSDVRLWTYRHPDPEAAAIAGHLAAAEHPGVHITVDGNPETRP